MRKLLPNEQFLLNGFHEYQLIDREWWETTDEYIEVPPNEEIHVESEI